MHDLSLYLLELLENSLRAEATHISVELFVDHATDRLRLTVEDDGQGLETAPQQVLDPFYTTKKDKKTGLGLSLLQAEAEAAGGRLTMSAAGTGRPTGVRVDVEMGLTHVDRPPLGDIFQTIWVMAATNPDVDFTVTLTGDEFSPPLIDGAPENARALLRQAVRHLDQGPGLPPGSGRVTVTGPQGSTASAASATPQAPRLSGTEQRAGINGDRRSEA